MTHYRRTYEQIEAGEGALWMEESKVFSRLRFQAKQRDLEFTITRDEWNDLRRGECIYGGKGFKDGIRLTMDRKNNARGYTPDNIVTACWKHNFKRGADWTHEAFLDIMAHYPIPCRNRLNAKGQ